MPQKFGWCFVGAGSIARKVADDSEGIRIVSVCSRTMESARRFAGEYGATAFATLAEAVTAPGVDGVYIATQHPEHHACTMEALRLGKPVLCEKPMAVNARQAREMAELARGRGLFLAEAMWPRYNPVIRTVRDWIAGGQIGEVHHVSADFAGFSAYDEHSRLFSRARGGGAILDIGVYPLALIHMVFGERPADMAVHSLLTPGGVDARVTALLRYSRGRSATLFAAMDTQTPWVATIAGTGGNIVIPEFWRARCATLTRTDGEILRAERDGCVGWGYQTRAVEELIRSRATESPFIPLDETIAIAEIMDDMRAQAGVVYDWD